ncbi:MAG: ribokinase [Stomatobaculum sp.]
MMESSRRDPHSARFYGKIQSNGERFMKVLCFGSLNIDYTYQVEHFVKKGETLSSRSMQVYSGGKGLNQSIALARAGVSVFHAGAIGEDGRFLLSELRAAAVDTANIRVLEHEKTGHAIIQNDAEGDNCILLYGGANQHISQQQIDSVLRRFSAGDCLLMQNEINNLPYLMREAHACGMRLALNPSPLDEKIFSLPLELVDILLLNEVEAIQLLQRNETETLKPGKAETAQALKPNDHSLEDYSEILDRLSRRFPDTAIVLTVGSDGSLFSDGTQCFREPAVQVTALDTTAAGDCYTGYYLAELLSGRSPADAMKTASAAAAICVTRRGAAPSIPLRAEVETAMRSAPVLPTVAPHPPESLQAIK